MDTNVSYFDARASDVNLQNCVLQTVCNCNKRTHRQYHIKTRQQEINVSYGHYLFIYC